MFLWHPPAETSTYVITQAGTVVGSSEYRATGRAFRSNVRMTVGKILIRSQVEGTRDAQDRLVRLTGEMEQPGQKYRVSLAGTILQLVMADGRTLTMPYKPSYGFGNLNPALSGVFLVNVADKAKGEELLIDGGAVLPYAITKLPARNGVSYTKIKLAGSIDITYAHRGATVLGMDVPTQKLRIILKGETPFEDKLAKYPELSQPTFETITERKVAMRTRDGATLVADIVRPKAEGRFPVVLTRTPYGRGIEAINGQFWASRGYVYVAQDCRGRGDSTGVWDPFVYEGLDGVDALKWISTLPYAADKVGMIGASYAGAVQWQVAAHRPPTLKAIIPQVSPPDAMHNIPYEKGVFMLFLNMWWSRIIATKDADFTAMSIDGEIGRRLKERVTHLPLGTFDKAILGRTLPHWQNWVRRETWGQWKGWNDHPSIKDATVPALHISGWFDGDGIGTDMNWSRRRAAGHRNDWLIKGPWSHAFNTSTRFGGEEFGAGALLELEPLYLRFFDTYLKGKAVGMDKIPRAKVFSLGENRWIESSDWPLSGSVNRVVPLGRPGARGDIVHNPRIKMSDKLPSPWQIGNRRLSINPMDHVVVDLPAATRDLRVGGPYRVRLTFKSSARDTDFFAMPYVWGRDGVRRMIGAPGAIRASYRRGLDRRVALTPGAWAEAEIRPWDGLSLLRKGERLGVVIFCSNFPIAARNLGTMDPIATAKRMVVQRNTIDLAKSSFSYWER